MQERHDSGQPDERWTPRQREVLGLLAEGRTNAEIAESLDISLAGAKWHVSEIISKLGVSSREEAAEYWTRRQRPVARASRSARALLGPVALKWAGASAGLVTATAGAMFVAMPLFAGDGSAAQVAEATPTPQVSHAVFSQAEAEAVARRLVQELVLDAYEVRTAPDPDAIRVIREQAGDDPQKMRDVLASGRRLGASDLAVVASSFLSGAIEAESNITGEVEVFGSPRDAWVFTLALRPPEQPDADFDPEFRVVFEDGTGELLVGGHIGSNPFQGTPPPDMPRARAVQLAAVRRDGVTFALWGETGDLGWRAVPGRTFAWCLSETDSRMPGGSSGTCGNNAPEPITTATFQSQKFAQTFGLVAPGVAKVRGVTEDGREVIVEPGPPPEPADFPWRGYILVAPGTAWFTTVEALDAAGNVISSADFSNHPVNPAPAP